MCNFQFGTNRVLLNSSVSVTFHRGYRDSQAAARRNGQVTR
jgi:hypothetical protein